MENYVMFHCHTEDSLLDSCTKAEDYIALALENGQKAISFSEHGKPLNWTEKWFKCKAAGIKYIHSVEIYLTESLEPKVRDNYHTVLMAKNMEGVRELNKLVSISCNPDHFYYNNRISFDEFLNISDNIISTSACLASPLNKLPESHEKYMELAKKYTFLEIQPHDHPEQKEFNKRLSLLADRLEKPLIVGTDTHSSSKYKAECRRILMEAKHKAYGDEDEFDLSYKTFNELCEMFKRQGALPEDIYKEALLNTNKLIEMTEDVELDTSIKYPILYGSREVDAQKFTETVDRKLQEKLTAGIIPIEQEKSFRSAIDEEMRVFRKLNMDGFMLSMSELISWCKEQGMAIGTARGSVGGSRVAYITDIIDLNPETWHTVFSRFCNEDRIEIGDIDIDCVESDRPAIFKHITERFGADKTARVASFGTVKSKGAIDEIGRALAMRWKKQTNGDDNKNPWRLKEIERIKKEFEADEQTTRDKYPELFYYYDGLVGTKISQSVHPAGMVISPVTLDDNFGTFDKDGDTCLMLDMDNVHDIGLAKYDFLVLKTVQVIRDTCRSIGIPYPKTNEINWNDKEVWDDMLSSPIGIFQMEGAYAFRCLRKFEPKNIFDMSIVTACIRPSGQSYRDELLSRKTHKNPSKIIDELLSDNLGYLIYQEDTIKFLQQICGLSGSEADNVRRAIGRKQKDRLDKAMPSILEGYCSKSPEPRKKAEEEAKEFLRIIEDSASYQFGYNHSIAYCLLGYLCAYYRYYFPYEFITSFLNNAANDDDIRNGVEIAKLKGIKVTMPKWGISRSTYSFDKEKHQIAKDLTSIKYLGGDIAEQLYKIAHENNYSKFTDVLYAINDTSLDTRQLDILIKIDFFSEFGNQRELMRINGIFSEIFKKGSAKQLTKTKVAGTPLEEIVKKYSRGTTKSGGEAKSYTDLDVRSIMYEAEDVVLSLKMDDLSDLTKAQNVIEAMGYMGYISGKDEDRPKLYITEIYPVRRKSDGKQFGYSVITKSIGSGKEARFTVYNRIFDKDPIAKGDVINCLSYGRDKQYFILNKYVKLT